MTTNSTMTDLERTAVLIVSDIETKADFVEYRLAAFEREQGREFTDAERHDLAHEIRRVLGPPFNAWIARKIRQAEQAACERAANVAEFKWKSRLIAEAIRALAQESEEVG